MADKSSATSKRIAALEFTRYSHGVCCLTGSCDGTKPLCELPMSPSDIVLHDAEFRRLRTVLARLQSDLRGETVMLINRSGQQLASDGTAHDIDLTSLASLASANIAATDGLAQLIGEPEFSTIFHQGKHRSIYISDVSSRWSLVVVFDHTVSVGVARWKVRRAVAVLEDVFRAMEAKPSNREEKAPAKFFTDEEIDRLFGQLKANQKIERKA